MEKITHKNVMNLAEKSESLVQEAAGVLASHIIKLSQRRKPVHKQLLTINGMLMSSSILIATAKMYSAKLYEISNMEHQQQQDQDEMPLGVEEFLKKMGATQVPEEEAFVPQINTGPAPEWETYAKSLVSHIASDASLDSRIKAKQRLIRLLEEATK